MARRVRLKRNAQAISVSDKRKMTILTDAITKLQTDMAVSAKQVEESMAELSTLMKGANLAKHEGKVGVAEMLSSPGKGSRSVRVKDYKKAVGATAFEDSASVTIAEAKKHLTDKELDAVCDSKPAKAGKPTLKVRAR